MAHCPFKAASQFVMPMKKRLLITLGVAAALAICFVLAFHVALRQVQAAVQDALGPRATVGSVNATWRGVEILDVRVQAERSGSKAWPAEDELRAERVFVVPDVASLFGDGWRVHSVTIERAYVSLHRTRDGKLKLLPSMLDRPAAHPVQVSLAGLAAAPSASKGLSVHIAQIHVKEAAVELFDASVRRPAHRLRLEQLQADLGPLALPELDQSLQIDLQAVFKGPQRDGRIHIHGNVTPSTNDAQLQARFTGVDLIALQPYLLRVNEGGVRRGTLDLELQATVVQNRLRAPGKVTLTNLELGGGGPLATFAGVPRQAVVAAMSRDGRIELQFTLEGRLDDPNFSINENLAVRVAVGLAETLGVNLGGVVQGLGDVVKGLFGR
jgi:hypothetical protein